MDFTKHIPTRNLLKASVLRCKNSHVRPEEFQGDLGDSKID